MRTAIFPGHLGRDVGCVDDVSYADNDFIKTFEVAITACVSSKVTRYFVDLGMPYSVGIGSFKQRIESTRECNLGISIHVDSCSDPSVSGFHCIHHPTSKNGAKLAKCVDSCIAKTVGRSRSPHAPDDGRRLAILYDTAFPVCLVEIGFATNPVEELSLYNENRQYSIAFGIVEGVRSYLYNGGSK